MAAAGVEKPSDRILLFGPKGADLQSVSTTLLSIIPSAEITPVNSLDLYRKALAEREFDIVVLDYDLPEVRTLEFVAQLRLRDNEPDVLLISDCQDPLVVRLIADSKRRYVVRDDHWLESMGLAVRDMLRIRRLESEMIAIRARLTEANAMLEEKNRRLGEFCSTIAHDIRGPLAGLILKVEYILDVYDSDFDERCKGLLKRSLHSAERLVDIVQAMYEFAKLGTKATNLYELSLSELVNEVLRDLSFDDSLDINVGVNELPHVWGNAPLLRRVFMNLITNAVKYNDKKEIIINLGFEGIIEKTFAKYAKIFVEDNGRGIDERDLKHIFGMFKRGEKEPRQGTEGMGVGLAVVQRIIELHFGQIEVDSTPGKGTRFTLYLPMERAELVK